MRIKLQFNLHNKNPVFQMLFENNRLIVRRADVRCCKEFKDLPVIQAKRLQKMNVDMNARPKGAVQKNSEANEPTAEKVVLPETQKTQSMVDDFSSREQKNLKMKFMNIYKKNSK